MCIDDAYGLTLYIIYIDSAVGIGLDVKHAATAVGTGSLVGHGRSVFNAGDGTVTAADGVIAYSIEGSSLCFLADEVGLERVYIIKILHEDTAIRISFVVGIIVAILIQGIDIKSASHLFVSGYQIKLRTGTGAQGTFGDTQCDAVCGVLSHKDHIAADIVFAGISVVVRHTDEVSLVGLDGRSRLVVAVRSQFIEPEGQYAFSLQRSVAEGSQRYGFLAFTVAAGMRNLCHRERQYQCLPSGSLVKSASHAETFCISHLAGLHGLLHFVHVTTVVIGIIHGYRVSDTVVEDVADVVITICTSTFGQIEIINFTKLISWERRSGVPINSVKMIIIQIT